MSNGPLPQHLRVHTTDGFPIVAQRFDPPSGLRAAVVIACATGVHARFYAEFASWLSTQGVGVCTFDYRYTGLSFPPPCNAAAFSPEERHAATAAAPRDIRLTETWGRQDMAAVIRYASEAWPGVPLTMFGHSLGAHLMTLVPHEWHRVTRFLNVNGGNAYYKNFADPDGTLYSLDTAIRGLLETDGVFRGSYVGLGHDLPYSPGVQWLKWFVHPHFSAYRKADVDMMRRMHIPYLSIGFADDETVNKRMFERHLGLFSHADGLKVSLFIDPAAHNPPWPPCGHVHSFRRAVKQQSSTGRACLNRVETIWSVYLRWILDGEVEESAGEFRRWTVADEIDVDAERAEHKRRQQFRSPVSPGARESGGLSAKL
ncbi:hypothetical protein BV25DRAFT_1886903 [Artomyces pyxidatus]|uniref:Uncharacterized protein n=1 Tax=Artomyces pyxidatus TaxID=48021 RepID=A0ACB8SYP0_9AGAM|nr:hypothetical protein BV25DRAFT_1886903 [Artomyces pyxidatus]